MSPVRSNENQRLVSLDQLRGYAFFGMLLVNAKGLFGLKFEQLSHKMEVFTYADTIAPLFMFVVGVGMRLSWVRRAAEGRESEARWTLAKRFSLMTLIAFALYAGWLWDALMDIGLAGLLATLVIHRKPLERIVAAFAMVAFYQLICMTTMYGTWIMRIEKLTDENTPLWISLIPNSDALFQVALNGGPLGPLSWCMMLLFGTVAYDWMTEGNGKKLLVNCVAWGVGLCAAGYAITLAFPENKALNCISAHFMTAPFPLWSTGLCLLHLALFYVLCDLGPVRIPTFAAVGLNPLTLYVLQSLLLDPLENLFKIEQFSALSIPAFLVFYGLFAALAEYMRRNKIHIRL